jgi:hypothetical protein
MKSQDIFVVFGVPPLVEKQAQWGPAVRSAPMDYRGHFASIRHAGINMSHLRCYYYAAPMVLLICRT